MRFVPRAVHSNKVWSPSLQTSGAVVTPVNTNPFGQEPHDNRDPLGSSSGKPKTGCSTMDSKSNKPKADGRIVCGVILLMFSPAPSAPPGSGPRGDGPLI